MWKRVSSMIHGSPVGITFSQKVGADPRDSAYSANVLPKGDSWVDGRLTNNRVTSRPDTTWPEVWSSMSKSAQKKAKQHWSMEKPKIRSSVTKKDKRLEAFESQKCFLHRGRDHSHDDHVADRGFHWWRHFNSEQTPVPISKTMTLLPAKISVNKEWRNNYEKNCKRGTRQQ